MILLKIDPIRAKLSHYVHAMTDTRLSELVKTGDLDNLKLITSMMDSGTLSSIVDSNAWSLLHHAAFLQHVQVVEYLLSKGCNPLKQSSVEPLCMSQQNGTIAM